MAAQKSPGELAYDEDVRRCPTYHDGAPRPAFSTLSPEVRNNWERHPTPREFPWRSRRA